MDNKTKKVSSKETLWKQHIQDWKKSTLSQTDYCAKHKLSKTAFSKWKQKLYPNLKHKHKPRAQKSKYGKNLKLSDEKIENLAECFLNHYAASEAAIMLEISVNTANRYFVLFREALMFGALMYPELFSGAGVIIRLGISPISKNIELMFQRDERGFVDNERKDLILQTETIMHYSKFMWNKEEIQLYHALSIFSYFENVYCAEQSITPTFETFTEEAQKEITLLPRYNFMDKMWKTSQSNGFFQDDWYWCAFFHTRELYNPLFWLKEMHKDLLWIIQKHSIELTIKKKNKYFDGYQASINIIEYQEWFTNMMKVRRKFTSGELEYDFNNTFGIYPAIR